MGTLYHSVERYSRKVDLGSIRSVEVYRRRKEKLKINRRARNSQKQNCDLEIEE